MTATLTSTVVEHGLPMTATNVRATLEGRKTQTRRVVRLPRRASPKNAWPVTYAQRLQDLRETFPNGSASAFSLVLGDEYEGQRLMCNLVEDVGVHVARCPYGEPGDRLWVREAWHFLGTDMMRHGRTHSVQDGVVEYRDGARRTISTHWEDVERWMTRAKRWRPSIHMPRWASRITLELTDVRVERVQNISAADCHAEGVEVFVGDGVVPPGTSAGYDAIYRDAYWRLWDSLNAKRGYGWDVNPWVWVLEFAKVTA